MLWLPSLVLAANSVSVTPADGATDSIVTYILSFGVLGVVFLALAWLVYKDWRLVSPEKAVSLREEARSDLIAERDRILAEKTAERDRLIGEKHAAERERDEAARERDEARKVTSEQLLPLLVQFTAATQSLLPILQSLAASGIRQGREGGDSR